MAFSNECVRTHCGELYAHRALVLDTGFLYFFHCVVLHGYPVLNKPFQLS